MDDSMQGMATLGESPTAQTIFSTYQNLLLSTSGGMPLHPMPLKTESLSYPSPTAPIGTQMPHLPSPSLPSIGSSFGTRPHSSSPLTINTKANAIHHEAKFYSFEEFRTTLEEWMSLNHHPFRVASSEMLRESEGTLNEKFRYRYIVYHCAHYGNPRRRGAGKRPNQNYLPCGCTANLRLNYSFTDHCLKITTLKTEHTNHEISAEAFAKCTVKLKKSPSEDSPLPPPKKGQKRAASASTDDSGIGFSPVQKKLKKENGIDNDHSIPRLSPIHTPLSESAPLTESTSEDWIPAPPPNLPAPTPHRPTPTYPQLFPLLQMHQQLLNQNLLFNFPQYPMGLIQSTPIETHLTYKLNEVPILTPIETSTEDKENSEFIDVENERPLHSPQEYATLQPVKSEPLSEGYEPIHCTLSHLQSQLMGDPNQLANRQAELESLLAKWGTTSTI